MFHQLIQGGESAHHNALREILAHVINGLDETRIVVWVAPSCPSNVPDHNVTKAQPEYVPSPPGDTPTTTVAMRVVSQAMWPTYRQGDVLYFDGAGLSQPPHLPRIDGRECVVRLPGKVSVVRFIMVQTNGLVTLLSHDGSTEPDVTIEAASPILWVQRHQGLMPPSRR